ncbi:MAG: ABC transporter ATP-binding protein [Bdellovibrionia bacterium]
MGVAVEFKNVSKNFGAKKVLTDINLKISPGTIHGLIGENGAGKSTAMNLLFGLFPPSSGQIFINDQPVTLNSPIDSLKYKIGMVHQHFMLAEDLTALENIILHAENAKALTLIEEKRWQAELEQLIKNYGFELDLQKKVSDLSVGEQQRLEILKVLHREPEFIILDEPTAVLTPQETVEFFNNLRRLKAEGKTILIITHKLKEILEITDEVSVLRGGKISASFKTSQATVENLAEAMIGKKLEVLANTEILFSQIDPTPLVDNSVSSSFALKVHRGEIVGVAGCEGNGQSELIQELLSLKKQSSFNWGVFPEDRLRFGVLADRPLTDNFMLGREFQFKKYGLFIDQERLLQATQQALNNYNVTPADPTATLGKLSGGNQQKFVIARELSSHPEFILAAHPTRGVDVGAVEFIHQQLQQAKKSGAGLLLISSDLDELMQLSDRILVLYKGKFLKEFSKKEFNEQSLGMAMGGVS